MTIRTDLAAAVTAALPNNTVGAISPADVRERLLDLIAAMALDADLSALAAAVAGLGIGSIAGLQNALATKATQADIANAIAKLTVGTPAELDTFLEVYNRFLSDEGALQALTTAVAGKAAAVHTHTSDAITDSTVAGRTILTATNKAAILTYLAIAITDIAGLQTALDAKASTIALADTRRLASLAIALGG